MLFEVLSTGSKGNAVIYNGNVMVDCGVPFSLVNPHIKGLGLVLFTHCHGDHFNPGTVKKLAFERPSLRFAACEWMRENLGETRNVDFLEIGRLYDYGMFLVSPFKLYHDVPNCGWRIFIKLPGGHYYRIFHATDTAHLKGITAHGYDLYAIEYNYDEETVYDTIKKLQDRGEFAHQKGSINSHLSEQQAKDFVFANRKENSEVLRLHETNTIA